MLSVCAFTFVNCFPVLLAIFVLVEKHEYRLLLANIGIFSPFGFFVRPAWSYQRFLEIQPEVVTLAGSLADARKYRLSAVNLRDIVDQLHDQDGFTDSRTAEQSDLAALGNRGEKVDYLEAGLEDFGLGFLVHKGRRIAMDRVSFLCVRKEIRPVDRFPDDIENPSQAVLADRDGNRSAGVDGFHTPLESVGASHRDTSRCGVAQKLCDFHDQVDVACFVADLNRVVDFRKRFRGEFDIYRRSDYLCYNSSTHYKISSVIMPYFVLLCISLFISLTG